VIELALLAGNAITAATGSLVFDAGGLSFSFAQTDYDFLELSLIGGGRLPGSLEWQLHAFLDRELHSAGEDDARLSSITPRAQAQLGPPPLASFPVCIWMPWPR